MINMDRKNLGFTLIELLVSIAIMGILLMIAIPGVLKIKEDNKTKKYEVYKSAVERAAKLYTDSNSKDMFQYDSEGTYLITLETLKGANLVKDYQEKEITCNNSETTVCVTKTGDEYSYKTRLVCTDKNGKEILIKDNYPNSLCQSNKDYSAPVIEIESNKFNSWINSSNNSIGIKIKLKDEIGFKKNQKIQYRFVNVVNNDNPKWSTHSFQNKEKLATGDGEAVLSYTLSQNEIPDKTGKYRLEVKGAGPGIVNYVGKVNNSVVSKETLQIDNDGPSIPTYIIRYDSDTGSIKNNDENWTNRKLYWGGFNSQDNGVGIIKEYQYSTNCTGDKTGTLSSSYIYSNNLNTSFCIRAVDAIGNIGEWSSPVYFKIDKTAPSVPTSIVMNLGAGGLYLNEQGKPTKGNPVVRVSKFLDNNNSFFTYDMEWYDFSATDTDGSGIDHYEYSTNCTGSKSGNLSNFYHYTTGVNAKFCIRSVDKAGNTSSWSDGYHFRIAPMPNTSYSSCTSSTGSWNSWSACSKNCGSGTKTRSRTITKTCNGKTTKFTEKESATCNNSCYSIINSSYSVCPSDQLLATKAECNANQKDKIIVSIKSVNSKKVHIKVVAHMNKFSQSFNNSCSTRRICLSKSKSACTYELDTFSVSSGWLQLNKTKVVFDKDVNISSYDKATYRVVVDDKGCSSKVFRFQNDNSVSAFKVVKNP